MLKALFETNFWPRTKFYHDEHIKTPQVKIIIAQHFSNYCFKLRNILF
ncbi:hypothetical protein HMPREF1705_04737 [Acetomicrobium hydrogeniformans ATCC BAA-1850]|uniref:Uncharacterized protein n=1 Tax=Acetomicrobium hydrogeniformans ATCC BAA-1850 TaxID=592015 RepID=A0A0T5X8P0_9BACT|nr:hypothetical protein HMPREF1705_04737 [Acetomicrobium hydrogeniformans ATCC BAA-1850]